MYFVMYGTDKHGVEQQRLAAIRKVVSYLRDRPGHPDVTVHCGGPTLDENGSINGTLIIMEAPSRDAAKSFLDDNPLNKLGLLENSSLRQFDWKTGCPK